MLAIIFDSAGAGEWLVLLAVLLIVMGPQRLPSTARKIGSYYSKFRRAAESFKRQILEMDTEMEREIAKVEQETESAMNIEDDEPLDPEVPDEDSDAGPVMDLETAAMKSGETTAATTDAATTAATTTEEDGHQLD